MDAELIIRPKQLFPDGCISEIVIWSVPKPVQGSRHAYKYRLFYGRHGKRIVGFDNERGKGDHCHLDGIEKAYDFVSTDQLPTDFQEEVQKRRNK